MKNVNRIAFLRAQVGLTQEELGRRTGVTRQTIAAWESDEKRLPSVAQLNLVSRAMGLPLSLLLSEEPSSNDSTLLFRADDPASLTEALRAILEKKASEYASVEKIVRTRGVIPESRPMDDLDDDAFVEIVAGQTRNWLGMGDLTPLGDVLALLEDRGLKVICHALPEKLAGFSAYTDRWGAVIVINEAEPTERKFFTALHELGHLIFHRRDYAHPQAVKNRKDPREKCADRFAGAVLLPAEVMKAELFPYRNRPWIPEPLLLDIKRRYWVSMRTVLMRAAQVGCISKEQCGRQIGTLNSKYGRFSEGSTALKPPNRLDRLERLVFQALIDDEITVSRAAEILCKPVAQVREFLEHWMEQEELASI